MFALLSVIVFQSQKKGVGLAESDERTFLQIYPAFLGGNCAPIMQAESCPARSNVADLRKGSAR
jgi:hypothetical protein